jgi:putative membrane protein
MEKFAIESLAGLPAFAAYFVVGLLLLGVFLAVYVRITPYPEIKLIREGNLAASASLSGAVIGFVLPLASAVENSGSIIDMLVWALIALLVQLLAHFLVHQLLPHLPRDVADGKLASGVFLGAIAVSFGLLNAACISY